jgi:hypothetical protein
MGKAKWLVALAASLASGGAFAENQGELQISPYVGYTHMRLEGAQLRSGETTRFDLLLGGVTLGYVTPIGIVIEAGTSNAFHDQWFDDDEDFSLDTDYAALAYQIDTGNGWRFVPKVGRMSWKVTSGGRELVDELGDRHRTTRGNENFYELSLLRHVSKSIVLGVNVKDVDAEFGHARSAVFTVSFGF